MQLESLKTHSEPLAVKRGHGLPSYIIWSLETEPAGILAKLLKEKNFTGAAAASTLERRPLSSLERQKLTSKALEKNSEIYFPKRTFEDRDSIRPPPDREGPRNFETGYVRVIFVQPAGHFADLLLVFFLGQPSISRCKTAQKSTCGH